MIVALVSHYLTNKLIIRRPLPNRRSFNPKILCGIRPGFPGLCLCLGYVPTRYSAVRRSFTLTTNVINEQSEGARLACIRHAASVHPEPGSNSSQKRDYSRLI